MITKSLKPIILAILVLSIMLVIAQSFQADLVFHRDAINKGEWWRILGGNFVHSNYPHLFMNLAGLWILGFLFIDSLTLKTFTLCVIVLSFFVGFGLYFFNPELQKYYGISGALYGLFLVGAFTAILQKDLFTGISIAILIIVKIIWDLYNGGSTSSEELIGIPVAVHAHLYGAIGAFAVNLGLYTLHLRKNPK